MGNAPTPDQLQVRLPRLASTVLTQPENVAPEIVKLQQLFPDAQSAVTAHRGPTSVDEHAAVTLAGQLAVAVHAVPTDPSTHVAAVTRPEPVSTAVAQQVGASPLQSEGFKQASSSAGAAHSLAHRNTSPPPGNAQQVSPFGHGSVGQSIPDGVAPGPLTLTPAHAARARSRGMLLVSAEPPGVGGCLTIAVWHDRTGLASSLRLA